MNKLGRLYRASPTFLHYISHSSLEKWILLINPEEKKKSVSDGFEDCDLKELHCWVINQNVVMGIKSIISSDLK